MSYTGYTGLGGVTDVLSAGVAVASDPCLPTVTTLLLKLRDIESAAPAKPASGAKPTGTKPSSGAAPKPPAPADRGIGLCHAVTPLKAVVFVRQRPWVLPVGALAIVGGLVGIGYALGRRRRT